MIELDGNRYGKEAIRLVKVDRRPGGHVVRDLTVGVVLEGDFTASYAAADNSLVIATDTMKNTVYALAPEHLAGAIEAFGLAVGRHFLRQPQVERATVTILEHGWRRLVGDDGPAPDAFRRSGSATRTAAVTVGRQATTVESGVTDLVLMKTSRSAFAGFPRDRFTTLAEASDRIMATRMTASWRHASPETDWEASYLGVTQTLLSTFAEHQSESVQHSIWVMGRAMLEQHAAIDAVTMRLPNLHHWAVDLSRFGMDDPGGIFVATTEPHGLIEATVRRSDPRP